jgi:hypothetical protein
MFSLTKFPSLVFVFFRSEILFNVKSFQAQDNEKGQVLETNPIGPIKIWVPKIEIVYVAYMLSNIVKTPAT